MYRMSFERTQLTKRDREPSDGESKDNDGSAGSHPCKEGSLIRKVIARAIRIGLICHDSCAAASVARRLAREGLIDHEIIPQL